MLPLLVLYGGGLYQCPVAFSAAAPQCRLVKEMFGKGFSTRHYTSTLVQRHDADRVEAVGEERLFACDTTERVHAVTVERSDDEGLVPASLLAASWWFTTHHPQFVPISLLIMSKAMRSLERLRSADFEDRVEVLYVQTPDATPPPDFLAPLSRFVNLRKTCEFTQSGDVRWMLSCPQLASVDVVGYNRPTSWNIGDVLPQLPALRELILYEGGPQCLSWLHKCTDLTRVTLDGCSWLTDFTVFRSMSNLVSLCTKFESVHDISALAHCPHLKRLEFGGTRDLVDGSVLGKLSKLEELDISHTGITDVSWIRGCVQLQKLFLFNVPLSDGLAELASLRHLLSLDLHSVPRVQFHWVALNSPLEEVKYENYNEFDTIPGVENLRNARMLRKLVLHSRGDVSWVGDCVMMEELDLSCGVADLPAVFALPNLRTLTLSTGTLDEESTTCAQPYFVNPSAVPRLVSLSVCSENMSSRDAARLLSYIRRCPSLKLLTLQGVPIPETPDQWLQPLASLCELHISHCDGSNAMNAVGALTALRKLHISGVRNWTGFSGEWACHLLESFTISDCGAMTDLNALASAPPMLFLKQVSLEKVPILDLRFMEKMPAVTELTLRGLNELTTLSGHMHCAALHEINIDSCKNLSSLDGLETCSGLVTCVVRDCSSLVNVDALAHLSTLKDVTLGQLRELERVPVPPALDLEGVVLDRCAKLSRIEIPSSVGMLRMRRLTIKKCPLLTSLAFVDRCPYLEQLSFTDVHNMDALPPLNSHRQLRQLTVSNASRLRDLSPLLQCATSIEGVSLSKCRAVENIELLSQLPSLTSMDLQGFKLTDTSWIGRCASLTYLGLAECTGATDYSAIANLTELKSLYISGCSLNDISWLSQLPSPPLCEVDVYRCTHLVNVDHASLPNFVRFH